MSKQTPPGSRWATLSLIAFCVVFVAGGLFSGWIFLVTVASLVRGEDPPSSIPRIIVRSPVNPVAPATPVPRPGTVDPSPVTPAIAVETPVVEPLPLWVGSERVTVLLLGIDQRDDEIDTNVPTRSDTMILATFDPASNSAGMLSIPRDLWVPIPGYGSNKINTAHFFGEMGKSGGGPELARKTAQYNLGVHIDYYARVDFRGFERLVDAVGGVAVDVERPIKDDTYPSEDYGVIRVYFPPGLQRMDGRTALRYARSRHADNDFGRIRRQQQVILAAREEALKLNALPRLPQMIQILTSSLATDMSPMDMIALANAARNVKSADIVSRSIDYSMVIDSNGDGSILVPDRVKIRAAVLDVFTDPKVRREAATIEVLNGTTQAGLATQTAGSLKAAGFSVVTIDTAPRSDYAQTIIIERGGKNATLQRLARDLQVSPANIVREPGSASTADITIILGRDARSAT